MSVKILFLTNGYPTDKHPEYCIFTKEQIDSILNLDTVSGELYFVNAREKGYLAYLKAFIDLNRIIDKYDMIHAFHGLSLIMAWLLRPNKKILISFLNSIENEYAENSAPIKSILTFLTLRLVKKNSISMIFKNALTNRYPGREYYLPNGVDTERFKPIDRIIAKRALGLDINKRYVLFVSSKNKLRPQKRYDRFNNVMEILKNRLSDVEELIMVNEPRERVSLFFNAASLHLLTSDFEGSPNSVKESIACETPVVVTDVGNVRDLIMDTPNCHIIYDFSVEGLAEKCMDILKSPDERKYMREKLFKKRLDINSKANDLITIYNYIHNG